MSWKNHLSNSGSIFLKKAQHFNLLKSAILLAAAFILPLSGPLIPGIILIVSGLIGIHYIQAYSTTKNAFSLENWKSIIFKTPSSIYYLIPICIISLYSLFLGQFDLNYRDETISIINRYLKLPMGIYNQVTQSLGVPLLLIIIGINVYLIKTKTNSQEGKKIIGALKWIGIFSAIYLLLLPLGGYRPYRPNILRYDTFLPITITLLYFYGMSSIFLLQNIKGQARNVYLVVLMILFAIFMNADRLKTEEYHSERHALEYLANSPDKITLLPGKSKVMSWDIFSDPKRSEMNAEILKFWGITKEKKLYYLNHQ